MSWVLSNQHAVVRQVLADDVRQEQPDLLRRRQPDIDAEHLREPFRVIPQPRREVRIL